MKTLALLLALVALPAAAQSGPVLLRWQVPQGGELAFRTTQRDATPPDSAQTSFMPRVEAAEMAVVLRARPDGEIDVTLTPGAITFADDSTAALFDAARAMQEAQGGLALHVRMTDAGWVTSDTLQQEQRNLVALFFGLPDDSVSVGDTWKLEDVRLLSLSGGLQPTAASRTGGVRLVALEGTPQASIAVLDYDHHERLESRLGTMTASFTGRGAFDVAAGTWRGLDARLRLEMPSVVDGTLSVTDQSILLAPVDP